MLDQRTWCLCYPWWTRWFVLLIIPTHLNKRQAKQYKQQNGTNSTWVEGEFVELAHEQRREAMRIPGEEEKDQRRKEKWLRKIPEAAHSGGSHFGVRWIDGIVNESKTSKGERPEKSGQRQLLWPPVSILRTQKVRHSWCERSQSLVAEESWFIIYSTLGLEF